MKNFTALGLPAGEERIRRDLDLTVNACRREAETDDLAAIILLGGYARGEGAVVTAADGTLRGFNDYDLLLVFEEEPGDREAYAKLSKELALQLEIDFVDLGLARREELHGPPASLFWYELGAIGQVYWQSSDHPAVTIPQVSSTDINGPVEGSTLLLNRGMALLWAGVRLLDASPGPADLSFSVIASHKSVLAAGDAHLLVESDYSVYQEARNRRLVARPPSWMAPGFLDAFAAGCAFRREPAFPGVEEARQLWIASRGHHEDGFRHLETLRLGSTFPDWDTHARLARQAAYRNRLGSPRALASAVKRRLRGGEMIPQADLFFERLPGLLYGPVPADRNASSLAAWKRDAMDLVRQWHP